MKNTTNHEREFYGTTTMGGKGQIVVPVEARKFMKLKKGEKLLVFGMGCDMLVISKLSNLEQFEAHLAKKLSSIRNIIKNSK